MKALQHIKTKSGTWLVLAVLVIGLAIYGRSTAAPDGHDHDDSKKKSAVEKDHGDHDDHKASGKDEHGHAEGGKDDHGHGEEGEGDGHGHGGHEGHAEEKTGAEYSETKGILIHDEAAEIIKLKTSKAYTEALALEFTTTARVYQVDHKHPPGEAEGDLQKSHALATAIITTAQADMLEEGHAVTVKHVGMENKITKGILVRLDRSTTEAIGQVEALIAIPSTDHKEEFGNFLQVTFSSKPIKTTAIPKGALLNAATGNFVYVEHQGRYLRTAVEVGTVGAEHIGITKGVKPGDVVVSNGTVGLWLIELRFTKGGGHSH
ncbi:MAG: hypothetical protein GXP30_03130 [Verrucomicrobia bacterium]|nr:hypothetical protein [Verrucomicrobiota bacterium]